jgi:hypothetical protein
VDGVIRTGGISCGARGEGGGHAISFIVQGRSRKSTMMENVCEGSLSACNIHISLLCLCGGVNRSY